jgi:hypothetical protein
MAESDRAECVGAAPLAGSVSPCLGPAAPAVPTFTPMFLAGGQGLSCVPPSAPTPADPTTVWEPFARFEASPMAAPLPLVGSVGVGARQGAGQGPGDCDASIDTSAGTPASITMTVQRKRARFGHVATVPLEGAASGFRQGALRTCPCVSVSMCVPLCPCVCLCPGVCLCPYGSVSCVCLCVRVVASMSVCVCARARVCVRVWVPLSVCAFLWGCACVRARLPVSVCLHARTSI